MEELGNTLHSSSIIMQSLTQTHQYLDSQHQELVEEISDMAAIADNLEADFLFADTANIHVGMLMMHQGLLCSTYNDQISTIDDLITYINDIQPLRSDQSMYFQRRSLHQIVRLLEVPQQYCKYQVKSLTVLAAIPLQARVQQLQTGSFRSVISSSYP